MQKELEIKLEDRVVLVKRLTLRDVGAAFKKIQKLPGTLSSISGKSNEEVFASFPQILGENWEELADVLSIATNLSPDELLDLSVVDSFAVVDGILEVNNFAEIKHFLALMRSRNAGQKKVSAKK